MASQRLNIGAWPKLNRFLARLGADQRGNVAMMFGLSLPVLLMLVFGGIDINRVSTAKANLQDALDAATLAAARSPYTSDQTKELNAVGLTALKANLRATDGVSFNDSDISFTVDANQVVKGAAKIQVKTLVANIILPPYGKLLDDTLPVASSSDVQRSSKNIEVALVLDVTGSMNNGKIESLKSAANQLVDIVVQDVQTPYYTKMSLVPYSMGVNLGGYANNARGVPTATANVTNIAWSTGSIASISAVTKANPAVLTTTAAHGFVNGDRVAIWNASGMTQLNGVAFTVTNVNASARTFQLIGGNGAVIDSRNYSTFTGSASKPAYVAKCLRTDCKPKVTANNHGLLTRNGTVVFEGVQGMDYLNTRPLTVSEVNTNDFIVDVVGGQTYTRGGTTACGENGCAWRVFTSASGSLRALKNSDCVSERAGNQAYTDASPSSARLGFNYPADNLNNGLNPCLNAPLRPLSSDKPGLKSAINALTIGGSTAGHIGAAWGWYTVSPNFNSLWPSNGAGPYRDMNVLKSVILMTDGEFNTPYSNGVISSDAGSGSGSTADHINQNAPNGSSTSQALKLCTAMKAQGITVYTVGFQVGTTGAAADLMKNCATSPDYAYLPTSSTDLSEAFKAIGRDITRLRITR